MMFPVLLNRGSGDRDLDAGTIFADPHRIVVLYALAGLQPSDDVILFGIAIGWDDQAVRLANDFFRVVAVQFFGRAIP
jgi:hypothetical protein